MQYLPLIIGILGGVIYLASDNPKVMELGRLAFWVGLFVYLLGIK